MADKEKKPLSTIHKRNLFGIGHYTLKYGAWAAPAVPAGIIIGVNFEDWFINSGNGVQLGFGFTSLALSIVLTYFAIAKKKKILEKVSAFWLVAILIVCWALSLLFLASIAQDLGTSLMWIALGVFVGAAMDETDTRIIKPKSDDYKGLVDEFHLDKRSERKRLREEARRKQAEEEAKQEALKKEEKQKRQAVD